MAKVTVAHLFFGSQSTAVINTLPSCKWMETTEVKVKDVRLVREVTKWRTTLQVNLQQQNKAMNKNELTHNFMVNDPFDNR
jgi:hypothetical protein